MKVSAVGFLFQNQIKENGLKGKNYTCIIHKAGSDGNFYRNVISSPLLKETTSEIVTSEKADSDILASILSINDKNNKSKFVGATIKDGIKETEIHSLISDKLFAVRTKDNNGRNHFRLLGKNNTQKVLSKNLYINA